MINRVRLDRFDYELKGSDPFNCETKLANDYQTPTILEKLRKRGGSGQLSSPPIKRIDKKLCGARRLYLDYWLSTT